ncbi:MAG: hypothetical protein WCO84_02430 [bacterium]
MEELVVKDSEPIVLEGMINDQLIESKEKEIDILHNSVIIPKATMDLFLKEKNFAKIYGLYCFYYYTARWQKTNQVWAVKSFVMKGMKIGKKAFEKAHKRLEELGLVKRFARKDENGKIKNWYVKVNYILKRTTIKSVIDQEDKKVPVVQGDQNVPVDLDATNALSTNSLNALSNSKYKAKNSIETIEEIYGHFKSKIQPGSRICPKARIKARLKKFSKEEIILAIDKFKTDVWRMANNARLGADWFFRSDQQIEKFLLLEASLTPTGVNTGRTPGVFIQKEPIKWEKVELDINGNKIN